MILCEASLIFDGDQNYLNNLFVRYSINPGTKSFFMANLVCLFPLGYICASANFGMFSFKISSIYALHPHQQTEPSHLLYSALLLTRLAYAVAYNFLELVNVQNCAFFDVMGPLSSIAFLGKGFNRWVFPTCLFTMVLLTVTDCYSRILNCIGFSQYGFDEDFTESQTGSGKAIIDRERKEMKEQRSGRESKSPASGNSFGPSKGLNYVDIER